MTSIQDSGELKFADAAAKGWISGSAKNAL